MVCLFCAILESDAVRVAGCCVRPPAQWHAVLTYVGGGRVTMRLVKGQCVGANCTAFAGKQKTKKNIFVCLGGVFGGVAAPFAKYVGFEVEVQLVP